MSSRCRRQTRRSSCFHTPCCCRCIVCLRAYCISRRLPENEGSEGSSESVGDAAEMDRWAERLTSKLLAPRQVEKEERVDGWVESVGVLEVPENELLEEETWAAPEVEAEEEEKVGSQWQAPTPAASTYAEQRKRKREKEEGGECWPD